MTERIIIAGSGGQGIMLLGKVLAEAAMQEDKFVSFLPSYGAEVRGGTCHCMVTISDKEVGSPYIDTADALIIMNNPSLEKFKNRVKNKGLLFINSSLAVQRGHKDKSSFHYPFTDIAINLGNIRVANIIALGCFLARSGIVSLNTVSKVISDIAPEEKKNLIEINQKALKEGAKLK
jgi:2-oxoglutarate ferredoxin oxidoreductase subunit gamma